MSEIRNICSRCAVELTYDEIEAKACLYCEKPVIVELLTEVPVKCYMCLGTFLVRMDATEKPIVEALVCDRPACVAEITGGSDDID
jgi:hypothetical protein